ncbi:MAG TPA: cyclase family protein [Vicinamibacterales bacterium]|nr:cyclase family protein [Vicinamibacterales bacterium]
MKENRSERLIRVDLSPPIFIHVPQAPRVERRTWLARGPGNDWHMTTVCGIDAGGAAVGLSNHTWSHLDAPYHLLEGGLTFDRLDPRLYLAARTRVVDLTTSGPERRETVDGVSYHTCIAEADLPADANQYDAVFFVTGFSALYASGYPMRDGADAHYPHITADAAARLAAIPELRIVAIDGPSVDKPHTHAAAHRTLLGRRPPVLLLETLSAERLRRAIDPLPRDLLLTIEPLRAFGPGQDGALASVYAYAPVNGEEAFFEAFVAAMRSARLAVDVGGGDCA